MLPIILCMNAAGMLCVAVDRGFFKPIFTMCTRICNSSTYYSFVQNAVIKDKRYAMITVKNVWNTVFILCYQMRWNGVITYTILFILVWRD